MNYEHRIDLSELADSVQKIRTEVAKTLVGQSRFVDYLLTALFAEGHVLIEGVPGVAKTLTSKILSKTLSVNFSRIQFTPDLMPSDILGTAVFNPKTADFEYRSGPIFSNLVLIDEINRSPAKTQAALFEVMEERQISNNGTTYVLEKPFMVIATQNPIEHEGTYRLPEAQLDRFLFKILIDYPDLKEEIQILKGHHDHPDRARTLADTLAVIGREQILDIQSKVKQIFVEENIFEYIARIVAETRNHKSLFLGASPRASVALLNASKAFAAIQGRDFVTPEDIQELVPAVLRHRIMLTPEKEMEGISADDTIRQIIQQIEVPR